MLAGMAETSNKQDLLLVFLDLAQCFAFSLGKTHTCIGPEDSCVPVHPYLGSPRTENRTTGSGICPEKQTGLPKHLQNSWTVLGRRDRLGRHNVPKCGLSVCYATLTHGWAVGA